MKGLDGMSGIIRLAERFVALEDIVKKLENRLQIVESHFMIYGPVDDDVFTMPSDEAKKRAVSRKVVEAGCCGVDC